MAQDDSELIRATETRVREIFKAADYAVSEAVGERPGEIVFFAEEPQRAGRLRIHWVVWPRCPEDLDAALHALDQDRTRLGADRAMAVLAQGSLPEGYRHDLGQRRVNAFTLRRFVFELLGVLEVLRGLATPPADAPHHPDQFLARRAITERGKTVPAVEHLDELLDQDGPWLLLVENERGIGRHTLLAHVAYRRARAYLADPDRVTPLLQDVAFPIHDMYGQTRTVSLSAKAALLNSDVGWFVEFLPPAYLISSTELLTSGRFLICSSDTLQSFWPRTLAKHPVFKLRLLPPENHEILAWYRSHLPEAAYTQLGIAWKRSTDVATIASHLANLALVREAALHATQNSDTPRTWLARFVIHYVSQELAKHPIVGSDRNGPIIKRLEDAALEEFALGQTSRLDDISHASIMQWLELDKHMRPAGRFANRLVRNYFLAGKIAAEVRTHGPDIFTRYQFPEDVLLFLAVLAPEIAAMATADRSAELSAHLQEEIEHQLQLTLAHPLKRSVGALRTNLGRLRRALPQEVSVQYAQELARIDDELGFLAALAENTRRFHEVPDEPREDILLDGAIDSVLSQLRDSYDGVDVALAISAEVVVRAGRHTLQEVLHCLLENAFHAARDPQATQSPRVEVRAAFEGTDVVRIEVLDSGPGVDPADRERIFEPRVTTKKGGPGRPLGTGMGLAIARKYANEIGGRVELDPAQPQTCFVLKLVAGGMHHG